MIEVLEETYSESPGEVHNMYSVKLTCGCLRIHYLSHAQVAELTRRAVVIKDRIIAEAKDYLEFYGRCGNEKCNQQ